MRSNRPRRPAAFSLPEATAAPMNASLASPEPLSSGLFCAPRNAEVVRDDLEKSVALLVRSCVRPSGTRHPVTGEPLGPEAPLWSTLGRSALLSAELVSLGWLRPLADLLDFLIRSYRSQPQDAQKDVERAREKRYLAVAQKVRDDTKKMPRIDLSQFIAQQNACQWEPSPPSAPSQAASPLPFSSSGSAAPPPAS